MLKYRQIESEPVRRWIRTLAPLVPYITVGAGILFFHNAWAAMLGYHLSMLLILALCRPGIALKSIFRGRDYRITAVTALAGLPGGILLHLLWPAISDSIDLQPALQNIGITASAWPVLVPYFILINPWLEEWYWRGYLGSDSRRPILNDLFFAGYHLLVLAGKVEALWLGVIFVLLTGAAWFWRQANRVNHGLQASMASHLAADASVMLAVYFIVKNG